MRKPRKPVNIQVGESLREIRVRRGLSQSEAAKGLRMLRQTLSTMEAGRQNISVVALSKVASFYGVTVTTLLDGL